jgi:DNA-binding NarL/FixJ family response regulator
MVMKIETRVQGPGPTPQQTDEGGTTDLAALAATLIDALEHALSAARPLLAALEPVAAHYIETARPTASVPGGRLSHREEEVLRLLAVGKSTRQIAAALFLSPRTVQRHVANLYPKIGAHCRAEATAYALRHQLA